MLKRSSTLECVSVRHFGQQLVSPITNTEYAFAALTVLKTRSLGRLSRRPEHYLRGRMLASTALTEKGPSAVDHPSKKGR